MRFIIAVDNWCLERAADLLVFLHEWLDIGRADAIKLCAVGQTAFAIIDAIWHGEHFVNIVFFFLFLSFNWRSANNLGAFRSPAPETPAATLVALLRTLVWALLVRDLFNHRYATVGLWLASLLMSYFLGAPNPPSNRGGKRKNLLARLKFKRFEPIPQT